MTNILTRIQDAQDEIGAFGAHNNLHRLIDAMRELKSLGAEAMISGNVLASKNAMSAITGLPYRTFQIDQLNKRFLAAYMQEFEPTADIVKEIKQPTLSLHQRLVSTLIGNGDLELDDNKRALCASMASRNHYAPLAKILDAFLVHLGKKSDKDQEWKISYLSELLAEVSEEMDWNQQQAKLIVNVFAKHAALLTKCMNSFQIDESGEWSRFTHEQLIRLLQPSNCPSLVEASLHQYAMKKLNIELIDDMIAAGVRIDPETLEANLAVSYSGSIGVYAFTTMELHLSSGGAIPFLVDFKRFGGSAVGKFINARLCQWGDVHPDACLTIAHAFLDHDPHGSGLFSQPLPRGLIERSERLRTESLNSDLGL
jgi:hypothetical protein